MITLLYLKQLFGRAWQWIKGHWRWIIFPVGVAGFLLAGRQVTENLRDTRRPLPPPPADDKTVAEIRNIWAERDTKLEELKKQHAEQLKWLSNQQHAELEKLEDKPLEEVVQWFDKLSS